MKLGFSGFNDREGPLPVPQMRTRLEGNPGAVADPPEMGEVRLPEMRDRKHDLGEFR